jgi:hypothetical protein
MKLTAKPVGALFVALCLLIAASVTVAGALAPPVASKQRFEKTYAPKDCQYPRVRPARIIFACADGGAYISHLRWRHWGRGKAGGHGIFHLNDCRPSCAEGHFHSYGAKIGLRKPGHTRCNGAAVKMFRVAKLRFPNGHPPHADFWRKNRLFCDAG